MSKVYSYVGPKEIKERVSFKTGKKIILQKDVLDWLILTEQKVDKTGSVIATYIIDEDYFMFISDRHDEHIAYSGGDHVLSAGEITFSIVGKARRLELQRFQINPQDFALNPRPGYQ